MSDRSGRPVLPMWIALVGAVCVGILTATQARLNGSLGQAIDDGYTAAFISFGSGFLILAVLCAVIPAGRSGVARLVRGVRARGVPAWMLLGGLAGAFTVATQGLTVATVGVALFTVGVVAGQTIGGLVLDRVGYGPGGMVAMTVGRLVGGVIVLAAVLVMAGGDGLDGVPWWMLAMPFLAGAGISWQQATNGRLRERVGSPLVATLVNFAGGTAALAVAMLVHVLMEGVPVGFPANPVLYLGGAAGVVYIFLSAALVRRTGVLLLGLGSVVGLLTTSLVLDALWPPVAGPSAVAAGTAAAIAFIGVVVAAVRWRR